MDMEGDRRGNGTKFDQYAIYTSKSPRVYKDVSVST